MVRFPSVEVRHRMALLSPRLAEYSVLSNTSRTATVDLQSETDIVSFGKSHSGGGGGGGGL